MSICPECGRKECCGASMSEEISSMVKKLERYDEMVEALEWAVKKVRISKWPDRELFHIEKRFMSDTLAGNEVPAIIKTMLSESRERT